MPTTNVFCFSRQSKTIQVSCAKCPTSWIIKSRHHFPVACTIMTVGQKDRAILFQQEAVLGDLGMKALSLTDSVIPVTDFTYLISIIAISGQFSSLNKRYQPAAAFCICTLPYLPCWVIFHPLPYLRRKALPSHCNSNS